MFKSYHKTSFINIFDPEFGLNLTVLSTIPNYFINNVNPLSATGHLICSQKMPIAKKSLQATVSTKAQFKDGKGLSTIEFLGPKNIVMDGR